MRQGSMLPILSTHQLTFNKTSVLQYASLLCSVPRGEHQPTALILAGPSQPQAKGSLKTSLFSDTGPLNGDIFLFDWGPPDILSPLEPWLSSCISCHRHLCLGMTCKVCPCEISPSAVCVGQVVQAFSIAGDKRGGNCYCPSLLKRKG